MQYMKFNLSEDSRTLFYNEVIIDEICLLETAMRTFKVPVKSALTLEMGRG